MKKGEVKWAALWLITMTILLLVFSSCQSYVDYLSNTPVRTVTVDRTPYYNNYNSFYNPYGLGYYNNFYNRPLYRPIYRPRVRTRTAPPVRRAVRPQRPIRNVKPRSVMSPSLRAAVGARKQKQ